MNASNPAILAKMAATLDAISGGRLILGLGAGWHEPEFAAFGIPFDHRVDRFEEALQIIVPLLRTGQVDFEGRYYRAANCELRPRGPRESGPQILIGAEGPRMLRLAARYADAWNTCWLGQPGALATPYAQMLAACADEARDHTLLCVVETPADQMMIEQTLTWKGLYFVLMGRLSPLDGIGPKDLHLEKLVGRAADGVVGEVVLATNFTNEGEATAHYISEMLKARGLKVSRLARGVPVGGELEYVDAGTIARAMLDRRNA